MATPGLAPRQKKARRLRACLAFIDESGFLMAPLLRRTWAPRGKTPILLQRGRSHKKVSAIAALVLSPKYRRIRLFFRLHPNVAINALYLRDFLAQLCRHLPGKYIIVWDRLNAHRSNLLKQYLRKRRRISFEFFPPYAPELNPVEYIWSYLKTSSMANRAELELTDLTTTTHHNVRRLQYQPRLLKAFLNHSSLFSLI